MKTFLSSYEIIKNTKWICTYNIGEITSQRMCNLFKGPFLKMKQMVYHHQDQRLYCFKFKIKNENFRALARFLENAGTKLSDSTWVLDESWIYLHTSISCLHSWENNYSRACQLTLHVSVNFKFHRDNRVAVVDSHFRELHSETREI